jgi:hypothetical protein
MIRRRLGLKREGLKRKGLEGIGEGALKERLFV